MFYLAIILISTLLSAFFSGSEIAFVSADKLNVEVRKTEGNRRAKILKHFYDNPRSFIISMLDPFDLYTIQPSFMIDSILPSGIKRRCTELKFNSNASGPVL